MEEEYTSGVLTMLSLVGGLLEPFASVRIWMFSDRYP
jgi:hypothetical protein